MMIITRQCCVSVGSGNQDKINKQVENCLRISTGRQVSLREARFCFVFVLFCFGRYKLIINSFRFQSVFLIFKGRSMIT